jgi:hypothetical protein
MARGGLDVSKLFVRKQYIAFEVTEAETWFRTGREGKVVVNV